MPEEPTNAVLATKIDALKEQVSTDRREEIAFHARLEGRLDQLTTTFAAMQQQVNVQKAETDARIAAIGEREDRHERAHQVAEQASEERQARGASWTIAISSLITAGVSIAAVAVTLLLSR